MRNRFGVDLGADRTALVGVSASAEFALAMGMRHPDVFGTVLAASPGAGYRPPEPMLTRRPRTYLVSGTEEPFFRENAQRWADALAGVGAASDVVAAVRPGGHGDPFWAEEFPRMVGWAFGRGW